MKQDGKVDKGFLVAGSVVAAMLVCFLVVVWFAVLIEFSLPVIIATIVVAFVARKIYILTSGSSFE